MMISCLSAHHLCVHDSHHHRFAYASVMARHLCAPMMLYYAQHTHAHSFILQTTVMAPNFRDRNTKCTRVTKFIRYLHTFFFKVYHGGVRTGHIEHCSTDAAARTVSPVCICSALARSHTKHIRAGAVKGIPNIPNTFVTCARIVRLLAFRLRACILYSDGFGATMWALFFFCVLLLMLSVCSLVWLRGPNNGTSIIMSDRRERE